MTVGSEPRVKMLRSGFACGVVRPNTVKKNAVIVVHIFNPNLSYFSSAIHFLALLVAINFNLTILGIEYFKSFSPKLL